MMNDDEIVNELWRKLKEKEISKIGIDEVRKEISIHCKGLSLFEKDQLEEQVLRKLIMKVG